MRATCSCRTGVLEGDTLKYKALMAVAGRQYGCITYDQALQVMSRGEFEHLVRTELVERVFPATYVVAGIPATWEQRAIAAALSVPGSALSHKCAARLWGMTFASSERVVLTAPANKVKHRNAVKVHRSAQLDPFVVVRDGIRVTTAARTLVDLSSCVSPGKLGAVLDQACNLGLVTLAEVDHCLDRMVTIGRSRITVLRELLAARDVTDERLESFFERKVLSWIRQAGLPKPEAQRRVVANGSAYRLDLCYPESKVAIEPDGPHHLLPSVAAYDRRRDADLTMDGWIVLRAYLDTDQHEFVPQVHQALRRSEQRPLIHPSHV